MSPRESPGVLPESPHIEKWQTVFAEGAKRQLDFRDPAVGGGPASVGLGVRRVGLGEAARASFGQKHLPSPAKRPASAPAANPNKSPWKDLETPLLDGGAAEDGAPEDGPATRRFKAVVYGLINTIVVTPVMVRA